MLVSIVAPAAVIDACSSSSKSDVVTETPDATVANDSGTIIVSDGGPVNDAAVICTPTSLYVDANLPDGAVDCDIYNQFSCDIPVVPYNDCFFALNDCPTVCPGVYFFNCRAYGNWCLDGSIVTSEDGGITLDDGSVVALDPTVVECATCPNGAGRRPRGLRSPAKTSRSTNALGRYFAETSHLERASIAAFRMLQRELRLLHAPRELVRSAERAARDEVRHARTTARLAKRHEAEPPKVVIDESKIETRSLEALAIENAVEGCVRETFGALVASWQVAHAADVEVACALRSIAADETRHAALAWEIAKWAENKLDHAANRRVADAAAKAVRALEADAMHEAHPDVVRLAGLPSSHVHRAMIGQLSANLWNEGQLK
ncbi:MAG: ferritin-like domain-containing protein [Polyangiaceae bacterium]